MGKCDSPARELLRRSPLARRRPSEQRGRTAERRELAGGGITGAAIAVMPGADTSSSG
jgi:hypothetical protein